MFSNRRLEKAETLKTLLNITRDSRKQDPHRCPHTHHHQYTLEKRHWRKDSVFNRRAGQTRELHRGEGRVQHE